MGQSYDFEDVSARTSSAKTHAFYSTASTDCWTRDMNQSMLKRIWFRPRVMRDVAHIDTSSTILGVKVKVPLFICPSGLAKMIHPDGEKALARAAQSSGILEIVSRMSSTSCFVFPDYGFRSPPMHLIRPMRLYHKLQRILSCSSSTSTKIVPRPKPSLQTP